MRAYKFKFCRKSPDCDIIKPEYRGQVTISYGYFTSLETLQKMLKHWTSLGYIYFTTPQQDQDNSKVKQVTYNDTDNLYNSEILHFDINNHVYIKVLENVSQTVMNKFESTYKRL